ncbi:hypothetical protein K474DRAFT_1146615 [Panus rudis PR-1116 ss-1]|nr:hypothetical protein K474DRAFT_1146615 [Panus rudis PR-1116 ss-1]
MPPKAKTGSASNAKPKSKPAASPTNGTASPVPSTAPSDATPTSYGPGRPDKKIYDAEQERIKAEIDAVQVKLTAVKEKITLVTRGGAGNERRDKLRAELDEIRGQQSSNKNTRGKVLDQLKALNDNVQKKVINFPLLVFDNAQTSVWLLGEGSQCCQSKDPVQDSCGSRRSNQAT